MTLLFTPAEAAARLGVTRQEFRKLMTTGQVPFVVIRRGHTGIVLCRRIAREDLDDYAERRSSAAG